MRSLGNLTQTLANIKPAVAAVSGHDSDRSSGNSAFVQAVADKNIELTIERIRERSPILRCMVDKGDIGLAGAMYDVHTGQVAFMSSELSITPDEPEPAMAKRSNRSYFSDD